MIVVAGLVPAIRAKVNPDARDKPTSVRHGSCLKRRTALILLVSSWLRIIWTRKGINAVRHQNIAFHGLLKHTPSSSLDRLADPYQADSDRPTRTPNGHLLPMPYPPSSA